MGGGSQGRYRPTDKQWSLSPSLLHDINNPLNALTNLLHLIETEPGLTESSSRYLKLAREEVHHLSQLVREALEGYHDTAQRQEVSVPKLLSEIVELYKTGFDARGIQVETRYCDDGSLFAFPQQLRRAFSNLLLNAADAVRPGATIRLRVCRAHEWSGEARLGLRVTFADSGSGIPSDDLSRIFQLFFSTKGAAGSGMGLATVQDAVNQHGGVIHVRSTTRPGRSGSVFSIFLPSATRST